MRNFDDDDTFKSIFKNIEHKYIIIIVFTSINISIKFFCLPAGPEGGFVFFISLPTHVWSKRANPNPDV